MKVLHVEAGRHLYGGARQVAYLLEGLAARDVRNVLLCATGSAIATAVPSEHAQVHPLPLGGDLDVGSIRRVRQVIKAEQPDVVHLHSRRGADTFGALAAMGTGAKVLLSRRVDNPESALAIALKYRLYDHVITISNAIREVLIGQGLDAGKLTCVHSAVEQEAWQNPASREALVDEFSLVPDQPVVGMAAQFIRRKGHDVLLDALPKLVDQYPHVQVLLFGKGREQERIQQRVQTDGLTHNVVFAGFRDDLSRWYGALDLLVHPALAEGLGVALLQGAAAGVPMVACDAGGIGEIVIDRKTGRLVAPGDADALAEAMLDVLEDASRGAAFVSAARELLVQQFSVDAMTDGNLAVYQRLLGA
ncbi:MAG: glycosyltransferase family 4 protein [Gammaproteobacteria bacterium]